MKIEDHPEYSEFISVREHIRKEAGNIPILFMWALEMMQELEQNISISAYLRNQMDQYSEHGFEALDPDLFTDEPEVHIEDLYRKKKFYKQIDRAVSGMVDDDSVVEVLKNRKYAYLDPSTITSLEDIFHQIRKVRNDLAHHFFIKNKANKTTDVGKVALEDELSRLVIDIHFVWNFANELIKIMVLTLNEMTADEIE